MTPMVKVGMMMHPLLWERNNLKYMQIMITNIDLYQKIANKFQENHKCDCHPYPNSRIGLPLLTVEELV